jgi:hypothetical protein
MKLLKQAIITGVVLEAAAFSLLLIGTWEFLGRIDAVATAGLLLHYPGFAVLMLVPSFGNAGWAIIVGVPLVLWCLLAYGVLAARKRLRRA